MIALGTALALVGLFVGLQMTHTTHFFADATDEQEQQRQAYENQRKESAIEHNGNSSGTDGTYVPPTNPSSISIMPSQSSDKVVLTTRLTGYSDGVCELRVMNGEHSISQTAQVIYAPDYSTCAGFDIPQSTLGSGIWNIELTVTSSGVSTKQTTTFEVR